MKITTLLAAFIVQSIAFQNFSQDLVKNYKPPKVIEGSRLDLSFSSSFNAEKVSDESRFFGFDISPRLSKFRYSRKLNYFFSVYSTAGYDNLYRSTFGDIENIHSQNASVEFEGATNYYPGWQKMYLGLNTGLSARFSSNNKPSFGHYIAPLAGYGRIDNAAEVSRALYFESVLKDEKVIKDHLPRSTLKKLIELFDKRNNQEFIYKFREDDEIEFFSRVDEILKGENITRENLNAGTILKLYRTIFNNKYLVYPKYTGYQAQVIGYYPFQSSNTSYLQIKPQLLFCGFYGIPVSDYTNLTIYGYFSKVFKTKEEDPPYYFDKTGQTSSVLILPVTYNIFQLNAGSMQLDRQGGNYAFGYSISGDSRTDFYFGSTVEAFHNFSPFIGLRGYISNITHYKDNRLQAILYQNIYMDFGIINNLVLTARISSSLNIAKGNKPFYYTDCSVYLTYTVF